jgi:hypothetical protein
MNGMTSGYRAAHGLPKANHDPEPWRRDHRDLGFMGRFGREFSGPEGFRMTRDPRPEFDVPDNPILVAARRLPSHDPFEVWFDDLNSAAWDHSGRPDFDDWEPFEIHAWRVLAKRAAVYA